MALGALFGATKIMYAAVRARTREIGTLRALGFGATPVTVSVLLEAMVLALLGAALGALAAWLVFDGREVYSGGIFRLSVSAPLVALGLAWGAAIALAGGVFPPFAPAGFLQRWRFGSCNARAGFPARAQIVESKVVPQPARNLLISRVPSACDERVDSRLPRRSRSWPPLSLSVATNGNVCRSGASRRCDPSTGCAVVGMTCERSARQAFGHGALIATLGAVLLAVGGSHPYLIAAAVSGYLLIGPIMATGLCELSRRRMAGESLGFNESIQGITRNPRALLQFGALLAAIVVVWFVASEVTLRSILQTAGPSLDVTLWGGVTNAANRPEITAYVVSGAVLASIVFMLSVVAVPMMLDRNATATEAVWASVRATLHNWPAMLIWSALIVVLSAIGFLTMLVGMILIAPLLGHATWHAYRDLVE